MSNELKKTKIYTVVDDYIGDNRINELLCKIRNNMNDDELVELMERVTMVTNSHIWGLVIGMLKDLESEVEEYKDAK